MSKGGKNDDIQAFFAKITTADKGMTFDLQGNPIIFKRPKVKEMESNMGYNVKSDALVQTFFNPKHAANIKSISAITDVQDKASLLSSKHQTTINL